MQMSSSRPFLIRALYEWIVVNNCSPYLLVNAKVEGAVVPQEYVSKDKIILNIAPKAVRDLQLGNQTVEFSARFAGKSFAVSVPIKAVMAIYAIENGRGMVFSDDDEEGPAPEDADPKASRANLKVVK